MQLRASTLSQSLWVSTLLGALRGAAKKSFTRIQGEAPMDAWSLSDFQLAVASLVAEHCTQFTEAGLDMQFSAKLLCDDIARFALLMKNGEFECNSKFIFRNYKPNCWELGQTFKVLLPCSLTCIFSFLKISISILVQHKP
jgi:hypothetical protein